jgi:catechol 2,3-dioxygenase-like lactoylglutathione lyase family enzyme
LEQINMDILASNTILYCKNWQAMVAFYKEIMGFQQTFLKDDWFIELRITEGCHLSLADEARCSIRSASGQGITLSFRVAGLKVVHRELEAQGVKPTAIKSHSWRAPYCYVCDPEGNRIELWNDTAD